MKPLNTASWIILSVNIIFVSSECFNEGSTWDSNGELEVLANIYSFKECFDKCDSNPLCQGYTWYGENGLKFQNVCVTFKDLLTKYQCSSCKSGKIEVDEDCFCDSGMGECSIQSNNFLKGSHGTSRFDCLLQCFEIEDCEYFTFYSANHESIREQCFFFTSCDEVTDSAETFHSAIDCENDFCSGIEYKILNDSTRHYQNLNGIDGDYNICDGVDTEYPVAQVSPDWQGAGW